MNKVSWLQINYVREGGRKGGRERGEGGRERGEGGRERGEGERARGRKRGK